MNHELHENLQTYLQTIIITLTFIENYPNPNWKLP